MNTPSAPAGSAPSDSHFTYRELDLRWDGIAGAWATPLRELGDGARLLLTVPVPRAQPTVLACEVALATLVLLDRLDLDARRYLEFEVQAHAMERYGHLVTAGDFRPVALHLPGDVTSDRFALSYRLPIDPSSVWTVRFRGLTPLHWRLEPLLGALGRAEGPSDASGSLIARLRRAVRPAWPTAGDLPGAAAASRRAN